MQSGHLRGFTGTQQSRIAAEYRDADIKHRKTAAPGFAGRWPGACARFVTPAPDRASWFATRRPGSDGTCPFAANREGT